MLLSVENGEFSAFYAQGKRENIRVLKKSIRGGHLVCSCGFRESFVVASVPENSVSERNGGKHDACGGPLSVRVRLATIFETDGFAYFHHVLAFDLPL